MVSFPSPSLSFLVAGLPRFGDVGNSSGVEGRSGVVSVMGESGVDDRETSMVGGWAGDVSVAVLEALSMGWRGLEETEVGRGVGEETSIGDVEMFDVEMLVVVVGRGKEAEVAVVVTKSTSMGSTEVRARLAAGLASSDGAFRLADVSFVSAASVLAVRADLTSSTCSVLIVLALPFRFLDEW